MGIVSATVIAVITEKLRKNVNFRIELFIISREAKM